MSSPLEGDLPWLQQDVYNAGPIFGVVGSENKGDLH